MDIERLDSSDGSSKIMMKKLEEWLQDMQSSKDSKASELHSEKYNRPQSLRVWDTQPTTAHSVRSGGAKSAILLRQN